MSASVSSSATATTAASAPEPAVLSVQSSVAFGHVGNAAAVFPMQYRGINVSAIHTLQFSFEPLYDCGHAGSKIPEKDVRDILEKLSILCSKRPTLFTHILSGYIGSPDIVSSLATFVREQKVRRRESFFACDPVCGDNGKLYVAPEVASRIREDLVPLSDAIFPNAFEATFLSGVPIDSHNSAVAAAKALHAMGPKIVVITSYHCSDHHHHHHHHHPQQHQNIAAAATDDGGSTAAAAAANTMSDNSADTIINFHDLSAGETTTGEPSGGGGGGGGGGVQHDGGAAGEEKHERRGYCLLSIAPSGRGSSSDAGGGGGGGEAAATKFSHDVFSFAMVPGFFAGTGDLLSALILSELAVKKWDSLKSDGNRTMVEAVKRSVTIVVDTVKDTALYAPVVGGQRELRIVANRKLLDL